MNLDRRRFLSLAGLGLGGIALTQVIPLGRVWSFPKKIVIAKPPRGWEVAPDGLMSFDQQHQFSIYNPDGGLVYDTLRYYWRNGRVEPALMSSPRVGMILEKSPASVVHLSHPSVALVGNWTNFERFPYPRELRPSVLA